MQTTTVNHSPMIQGRGKHRKLWLENLRGICVELRCSQRTDELRNQIKRCRELCISVGGIERTELPASRTQNENHTTRPNARYSRHFTDCMTGMHTAPDRPEHLWVIQRMAVRIRTIYQNLSSTVLIILLHYWQRQEFSIFLFVSLVLKKSNLENHHENNTKLFNSTKKEPSNHRPLQQ